MGDRLDSIHEFIGQDDSLGEVITRNVRDLASTIGLVRKYAARDLGDSGDSAALDPLLTALSDPEPEVLLEVIHALERLGDERAAVPLRRFAESGNGQLNKIAMVVASRLGGAPKETTPMPIHPQQRTAERQARRTTPAMQTQSPAPQPETAPDFNVPPHSDLAHSSEADGNPASLPGHATLAAPAPQPTSRQTTASSNAFQLTGLQPDSSGADNVLKRAREMLIRDAMLGTDAQVVARAYGFRITVPLLGGTRKQTVRIVFEYSDPEGDKVILIHSMCGNSTPVNYRWALDANRRMMYGRIAIRHDKEGEYFMVLNTLLETSADALDIRKNVLAIADKADWIERQLSPEDRY